MVITYSGSDGAAQGNVGKTFSIGPPATTTQNRVFFSFRTGNVEGTIIAATFKYTVASVTGTHNHIIRVEDDALGNAPNSPSYADNWGAWDNSTIVATIPISVEQKTANVTKYVNHTGDTDIRIATDGESEGGNFFSAVYLQENGSNEAVLTYTTEGLLLSTPTDSSTPSQLAIPSATNVPTSSFDGESITADLLPHDDWGIRLTASGEIPPDFEGGLGG
jgi:hypothetical protein